MKKMRKVLALLLGGVVAMSSAMNLTADANSTFTECPFDIPEGYGEYDDAGLFLSVVSSTYDMEYPYKAYACMKEDGSGMLYRVYHNYEYNITSFVASDTAAFEEIYAKYSEELDFDIFGSYESSSGEGYCYYMRDVYNQDGKETADSTEMENKSQLVQEMSAELYAAGCITKATYTPCRADYMKGYSTNAVTLRTNTYTGDAETEVLQGILSEFTADGSVTYDSYDDYYTLPINYAQAPDLMRTLQEVYPNAWGGMGTFLMTYNTESAEAVDILAAFEETGTTGDINADGTIDITDAMLILQHYAESAVSGIAAASETNMDVNGDGTVGIDDASEVLQIYAQNAAGVNAS